METVCMRLSTNNFQHTFYTCPGQIACPYHGSRFVKKDHFSTVAELPKASFIENVAIKNLV